MHYRSGLDLLYGLLLALGGTAAWLSWVGAETGEPDLITLGWVALGFGLLMVFVLCWPCHYDLTDDALLIRCGVVRKTIPYGRITRVAPSWNVLSAPALSLRRVRIDLDGQSGLLGFALVSPKLRDAFIADLRQRAGLAQG